MQEPLPEVPLPGLLQLAHDVFDREVFPRLHAAGYTELRPGHACVFGGITPEGDRLTALAERAALTKQAVGEVVSELERLGYVERVQDPDDGRAKIIRLTDRGTAAWALGWDILAEIRERWEKRYGAGRVRDMADLLREVITDEVWNVAPRAAA